MRRKTIGRALHFSRSGLFFTLLLLLYLFDYRDNRFDEIFQIVKVKIKLHRSKIIIAARIV